MAGSYITSVGDYRPAHSAPSTPPYIRESQHAITHYVISCFFLFTELSASLTHAGNDETRRG